MTSFLKFMPAAHNIAITWSPSFPFKRFLSILWSYFRWPMPDSTGDLSFIQRQRLLDVLPLQILSHERWHRLYNNGIYILDQQMHVLAVLRHIGPGPKSLIMCDRQMGCRVWHWLQPKPLLTVATLALFLSFLFWTFIRDATFNSFLNYFSRDGYFLWISLMTHPRNVRGRFVAF